MTETNNNNGSPRTRALENLAGATHDYGQKLFSRFIEKFDHALGGAADSGEPGDAEVISAARKQIAASRDLLARVFADHFMRCFDRFCQGDELAEKAVGGRQSGFADPSEFENLEEEVAFSSLCLRLQERMTGHLWALNMRLSVLNDGRPVDESTSPLAPSVFCRSLKTALKDSGIPFLPRLLAYRVFEDIFQPGLDAMYRQVNRKLQSVGILPDLQSGGPKEGNSFPWDTGGSAVSGETAVQEDNQTLARRALRDVLVQHQALIAGDSQQWRGQGNSEVDDYSGGQLVMAVARVQEMVSHTAVLLPENTPVPGQVQPADMVAIREEILTRLAQSLGLDHTPRLSREDRELLYLVDWLFEYLRRDPQLPSAVKALLSYLYTPFLKLAFRDPDFFQDSHHPGRRLFNRLADAGERWVGNDGTNQFGIYNGIRMVVEQVLTDYHEDIAVLATLDEELSRKVEKLDRRVQLFEKRAVEKAAGEDRLLAVKRQVAVTVRRQTRDMDIPEPLLRLIFQPWSDYLAFILLRHGSESSEWQIAASVIDDLLWGLCVGEGDNEKSQWRKHWPLLQAHIRGGLETIGSNHAQIEGTLREIGGIFDQVLAGHGPAPADDGIRRELVAATLAGEAAADNASSLAGAAAQLEGIREGTWFEMENGARVKLVWINRERQRFLLVDQRGRHQDSFSGGELAERLECGVLRRVPGGHRPLFDRIFDAVIAELEAGSISLNKESALVV